MRGARQIREALGMVIMDVARQTSIDPGGLSKFERGEVDFGLEKMRELARFYGCTLDELVAEIPAEAASVNGGTHAA